MNISDKKCMSLFRKEGIKVSCDGIGNTDISLIWDDGYNIQHISLGGYCDMEPFKWELSEGWQVGKSKTGYGCEWSVTPISSRYVEGGGTRRDPETGEWYWNSDYVDEILRLKKELLALLPSFKEKTDKIHEEIVKDMYEFTVTKCGGVMRSRHPKWIGRIMVRGKSLKTNKYDTFLEAKEAADRLFNTFMGKEQHA